MTITQLKTTPKTNTLITNNNAINYFAFNAVDSMQATITDIIGSAKDYVGSIVLTVNTDIARRLKNNEWQKFADTTARMIITADGKPVALLASFARNEPITCITGADMLRPLCSEAAKNNIGVFIVGGKRQEQANDAVSILSKANPTLKIDAYSPQNFNAKDSGDVIAAIKNTEALDYKQPIIIIGALGSPKQDDLAITLLNTEGLKHAVCAGFGASIDFITGHEERAPEWVQNLGLEWLYRIIQDPNKLGRYIKCVEDLPGLAMDALEQRINTR